MSNPIADIGTAISGGQAVSNLVGGGKGGSSSFTEPSQVNIPPFYSSGGITPEQEALAQYGKDEANVATRNTFGASGTGLSTMATQATAGNRMGQALKEGELSNTDEDAMYKAYQNEVTATEQNLQNQTTLDQLASQANTFNTNQLTNAINQLGKTASTASSNSDFSQGASDVINSFGG